MQVPQLKVKIRTLAAEAHVIRSQEIDQFQLARDLQIRQKLIDGHYNQPQIDRFLRRIKSKKKRNKARQFWNNPSRPEDEKINRYRAIGLNLQEHRRGIVRREARHSLLAYAYLRGRSFARTENNSRWHELSDTNSNKLHPLNPDWSEVEAIAQRFSKYVAFGEGAPWDETKWAAWKAEAEAFMKAPHVVRISG